MDEKMDAKERKSTNLLCNLQLPEGLKELSYKELEMVAAEIRQLLVSTIARTGGHLAPNLGVVELTLALHRVFNSPQDKIIWDVGHQSYVHKLLTGRLQRFSTLRQLGGISGFPKPEESEHDVFATGHSSTSISAAVGLAKARDLSGERHKIIAVIGDGSMTGGMAFEALNHAGHLNLDLMVVLNDNEMSISRNVGALSSYLSRVRMNPAVNRLKEEIEHLIHGIPGVGEMTVRYLEKFKDSLKYLVIPGILFEELGFSYFGPVDGHNIRQLVQVFRDAAGRSGPVLIHVLTKKGKGYLPAEEDPLKYHGVSGFELPGGHPRKRTGPPAYTEVFGETLVEIAREDQRVVAITAAMPEGTGLLEFARVFPDRFIDVGIAEQHAVTMAAGLARGGKKPVVAIYSSFLQRAYDQILHDVCLQDLPVVFALDRAGVVGEDGPTHHGVFDLAYLRSIPGITIMAPKDENELRAMLRLALAMDKPVAIRYPRGQGQGVKQLREPVLPGRAEVLCSGEQVAIFALGPLVAEAEKAARRLSRMGISCAVINARFVKPLDREAILHWARRVPHLVTVEDHNLTGGFGSAVLELLAEEGVRETQVTRMGYPDRFIEFGPVQKLRDLYGLNEEGICQVVTGHLLPVADTASGR